MPTWPAELPQEPNGNDGKWTETPPDTVLRDKNDRGPDNTRRGAVAGVRKLSLPYVFRPIAGGEHELDIFDTWFREDLQDGALSFTRLWPPAPRATQTVTMRIVCPPPPTYEHQGGGVYNVTLNVEILP